jgi:hypothetical protein
MLMKKKIIFLLVLFLTLITNGQIEYPQNFFTSPIKMKIAIAGTFGELRNNHFHSGIDIKTRQKKNIPICAAQDGYISRIKVSSYGFGKAVYINHKQGFTTVYAHLEKFQENIQKKALKEHYKKEVYEIDFSLKENEIKVKKGDTIGFSGNTGSSTAPHLHFEIRETKTQKTINPMLFGLPILDTSFPIINSILIYYLDGGKNSFAIEKINKKKYIINDTINVNGPFNIGINTYDLLDAAPNKNGVYSIKLYLKDSLIFSNTMDMFAFHETKYINSHIDYEYHKNNDIKFQKCFLDPNNKISTNDTSLKHPIGKNLTNGIYEMKIVVSDSYENNSVLTFYVRLKKTKEKPSKFNNNIINYQQVFEFQNEECKIYIPNNSLYRNHNFTFEKKMDSILPHPIYKVLDDSIPSHKSFIISIQADSLDKDLRQKAMIAKYKNGDLNCIKSKWEENHIIGKSSEFGEFTVVIDTVKPIIQDLIQTQNKIELKIEDELSGIQKYRGEINGKWVLMEYDYKTKSIKHTFETNSNQKNYEFNFTVSDKVGNTNTATLNFIR